MKTKTPSPSHARQAALAMLIAINYQHRQSDSVLTQGGYYAALQERDRQFARALVMAVLRRRGQIDSIIAFMLERPLPAKLATIHTILQLGIAQLLWLETPAHAGVNETVELVAQEGFSTMKGLVNAVLQRVARERESLLARNGQERINTPIWLWQSWVEAYGEETATQIAQAHFQEPSLDISVKSDAPLWAKTLGGAVLASGTVRIAQAGKVQSLSGYEDGQWWVQDIAASLPAKLMGDVKGKYILDMCAAPGGKAAQLVHAGGRVVAVDRSEARMELVKENMRRLKLSIECAVADAAVYEPVTIPDAILLDAPCSATGTLRRHPDVAWHKAPEDVEKLSRMQAKLLARAVSLLKQGGLLVYCVCSLQPEEGERQINRLLAENSQISIIPVRPAEIGGMSECITPRGELRTLPFYLSKQGGMDGFYAVRLMKQV